MSIVAKIQSRTAKVAVVGLGYVGLPLLKAFFDAGFPVIGFDVDPKKILHLERGENYIDHLGADYVRPMCQSDRFSATTDFDRLSEADAVLICVPTPLGPHHEPDISFVERATDMAAKVLRNGQLIVLESTTYPGTTRQVMLPRLEAGGLKCGRDFYLAFSPEREDPGRRDFNTQTIPKLVGGIDGPSGEAAVALYAAAIAKVIPVRSAEIAEAAKLLENIYRSVNIAMINEMKIVMLAMGIDVFEVIEAAATKPFGFQKFYPGPGLGGHCIPIDPFYLTWKAREFGQRTKFIELAGEINHSMPDFVVQRVALALNSHGKAINGSRILVLGLAYKPDVADVRESPSFDLIEKLKGLGANVDYHDPHIPATHKMRRYDLQMKSISLSPKTVAQYDCVLIATHHSAYDWPMIARSARLIVDSRGAMRGFETKPGQVFSA
jgi:UDP-N-acetyl-D-glucosamine dehydrogenase